MSGYGSGGYGLGPYGVGGDFTSRAKVWLFRTPNRPNPRVTPKSTKAQRGLYRHFVTAPVGIALIRTNGVWAESPLPTHNQLEAADLYYMGGRDYFLTAAEGDVLTDAGYGDLLISLSDDTVGYGLGVYGAGSYGA